MRLCLLMLLLVLHGANALAAGRLTDYVNPLLGTATLWSQTLTPIFP